MVDRASSQIAFISSTQGGVDIEKVADESPEKIITKKIDYKKEGPSNDEITEIISIFDLKGEQIKEGKKESEFKT